MVKIFSPILHHALIYIDDILLFSHDHQTHQQLLSDFLENRADTWHHAFWKEKKHRKGIYWLSWHGLKRWSLPSRTTHRSRIIKVSWHRSHQKANSTVPWNCQLCQRLYFQNCGPYQPAILHAKKDSSTMGSSLDRCCKATQKDSPVTSSTQNSLYRTMHSPDRC